MRSRSLPPSTIVDMSTTTRAVPDRRTVGPRVGEHCRRRHGAELASYRPKQPYRRFRASECGIMLGEQGTADGG